MFISQLAVQQWLQIPLEFRHKLIEIFNIPQSSYAQVVNNEVMSDGHTYADLSVITVEKLQEYLGSKEVEFLKLMDEIIAKFQKEYNEELESGRKKLDEYEAMKEEEREREVLDAVKNINTMAEGIIKKRGRPSKQK